MSAREKLPDTGLVRSLKPVLISSAVGIVVCALVLLLFSVILSTQNVPQSLVDPMATASACAGALVAGYVCAKMLRERGLLCGLVSGIVLSFVMLLASLGISDGGFGIPALFKIVFLLICSMLGGVLGVNTKKRRKSAKR